MEKIIVNDYFVEVEDNTIIVSNEDGDIMNVITYLNKLLEQTDESVGLYFGDLNVLFRLDKENKESFALMKIKGNDEKELGDSVYEERVTLLNLPIYEDIVNLIDNGKVVYMQNNRIVYVTYENGVLDANLLEEDLNAHYTYAKRRVLRNDIKRLFDENGIEYIREVNNYSPLTLLNLYKLASNNPSLNKNYYRTIFTEEDCDMIDIMKGILKYLYTYLTKLYIQYDKYGMTPQFIQKIRADLQRVGLVKLCKYVDYDLANIIKNIHKEDIQSIINSTPYRDQFFALLNRIKVKDNYMSVITNGLVKDE